jgi:hypothetical protein
MTDKPTYVSIPIADLMCVDMPSAEVLTEEGAIHENDVSVFFNTLQASVSVWTDLVERITPCPDGWADSRHQFIALMRDVMEEAISNDDPEEAWPLRQRLALMVNQFDGMMDDMARPFTGPDNIRDFYHNMASRVRATFEEICGESL